MLLKATPDDFRVRELLDWDEAPDGDFYVHRLHKEKLSTHEALSLVVQHGGVDRKAIAYAGLKDRQAVTDQHISIAGRAVELRLPGLKLTPVGRSAQPITSRMSRGNAFTIVVRDLQPFQAAMLRRALPSLQVAGFPNYFDDQRFGCLRHGQGFAMLAVLRGDYERALHQLIAAPSPRAITGDVKLKRALQARWGDWEVCAQLARGPVYRPLFEHLCSRRDDFRGAIELLPQRLRVIHSFAYQSFLWNRAVSRLLRGGVPSAQRLRITTLAGDLLAWKYLEPQREQKLLQMSTPLFAPDGEGGSPPFRKAMVAELENADLRPSAFEANVVPGMVWREEQRAVLIKPLELGQPRLAPDDMNPGRMQASLSFSLPRGSYATMLLKRLFAPPFYTEDRERRGRRGGPDDRRGGSDDRRGGREDRGSARPPAERTHGAPWRTNDEEEFEA